ncbi:MAG: TIM barrel protein [Candidatus Zipacnadales bacterium]
MAFVDLRPQAKIKTPAAMVKHLNSFSLDLKFSAGVWFFAPGGGRFHDMYLDRKYEIEEILEIAASLQKYGLVGLEAHYPNEVSEDNLDLWESFIKDTGMKLVMVAPFIFFDKQFEWGALSSPIAKARRAAIQRTIETLQMCKRLDVEIAVVWPGIDGYENPFGYDLAAARHRFCSGLAEAMDAVPAVRVAEEPKPYEPRGHILYGTTPEGILMALKTESLLKNPKNRRLLEQGHALVALNPEVGHVHMGFEDLPSALSLVLEYGRLAHTHWNSQPLGNYDQDLNVGVVSPEQAEAALYVLKMHGYRGYFGIDINPERMPVRRALLNCMDALKAMNDRIDSLDHESIIWATYNPHQARGYLEALLIRARYPQAKGLSPMMEIKNKPTSLCLE